MTRLVRAEFRKLLSTRLWCWMLLAAAAWTAGYTALAITLDGRPGDSRHGQQRDQRSCAASADGEERVLTGRAGQRGSHVAGPSVQGDGERRVPGGPRGGRKQHPAPQPGAE